MHILLDHIVAAMIGSTLLLILLGVQVRSQQTTVEANGSYGVYTQALDLAEVFEQDLRTMSELSSFDPQQMRLSFRVQPDVADTTTQVIAYQRVNDLTDGGEQVYRFERYVNGTYQGGSSWLEDFELDLRDATGTSTTLLADVREVFVTLAVVNPYAVEEDRETRWEATYQPPMLHGFTF